MNRVSLNDKGAPMALLAVAVLAVALIASWLWFLRDPAPAALSQDQLNTLAAQAGKSRNKNGRDADPYKDEAVKSAIRKHALEIQKPWLAYLAGKPAKTEGAMTLAWTIAADGKVTQVAVSHSDFDNTAFNDGVRKAMAAIVFPPPPGGQAYDVTHRLSFKQEADAK